MLQETDAHPADMARLKGLRILLIEDNVINQIVAEELLVELAQVRMTVAENGQDALDRMSGQTFDLVLMDIQMPVMDGYVTTQRIRANPAWAQLPVIAMTAHALQRDREQCLQAGMNDFVIKPFEPHALFAVLARWAPAPMAEASADVSAA